ncbi:hypothetical protein PV11_03666 [Exophiala sideris]|uniref:Uncharacterized protein n=1 Tax=Exophiala sideris TaxID=1016849 RepID=A0A0D1X1V4_9EURO|nr:hypothetical protein PV11_03666 [Exophiala sideris]
MACQAGRSVLQMTGSPIRNAELNLRHPPCHSYFGRLLNVLRALTSHDRTAFSNGYESANGWTSDYVKILILVRFDTASCSMNSLHDVTMVGSELQRQYCGE